MRMTAVLYPLSLASALLLVGVADSQPATRDQAARTKRAAAGAHAAGQHVMITADEMKFGPGPDSLPRGAQVAIVEGDPTKQGPFTMRARVPANYRIPPHWHPAIEHVTVMSGTVFMGSGDKLEATKAKRLPTGAYAVMPQGHHHFFFTQKEPAEIQLHGMGPWGITYVNPADDPRQQQRGVESDAN